MLEEKIDAMTEALNNLASAVREQTQVITASQGTTATPAAEKPAGTKAKSTGKAKKETKAKEEKPVETEPQDAPEVYDYDADIKPRILELSKKQGRDAVLELFARFGVAKGPDLLPEQYVEIVAKIDEMLNTKAAA